jgi:FkbM family methyltransferase
MNFLDVGARGGLASNWALARALGYVRPVYCEPDADEARRIAAKDPGAVVLEFALGANDGLQETLHLTAARGQSSLLKPNALNPFYDESWRVESETMVGVRRFDRVWEKEWGAPEFVKIDVQGYELEVLKGFGDLLEQVLCVELECQLVQFYLGQPLFQDVHDFMRSHGFDLVKMRPVGYHASHVLAEMNAYFVRASVHTDPRVVFWKRMNDVGSQRRMTVWGY